MDYLHKDERLLVWCDPRKTWEGSRVLHAEGDLEGVCARPWPRKCPGCRRITKRRAGATVTVTRSAWLTHCLNHGVTNRLDQ